MIQIPDLTNGLFEVVGSAAIWLNVVKIWRDKMARGVSLYSTAFFTSWGAWNLYYYPHLHQWFSFAGGILIVAGNAAWISLMWRYRKS